MAKTEFHEILKDKREYYGETEAAIEFAVDKYLEFQKLLIWDTVRTLLMDDRLTIMEVDSRIDGIIECLIRHGVESIEINEIK